MILLAAGSAAPLATVLRCLQNQSLRSGIEIVIVAPRLEGLDLAPGQIEGGGVAKAAVEVAHVEGMQADGEGVHGRGSATSKAAP